MSEIQIIPKVTKMKFNISDFSNFKSPKFLKSNPSKINICKEFKIIKIILLKISFVINALNASLANLIELTPWPKGSVNEVIIASYEKI